MKNYKPYLFYFVLVILVFFLIFLYFHVGSQDKKLLSDTHLHSEENNTITLSTDVIKAAGIKTAIVSPATIEKKWLGSRAL